MPVEDTDGQECPSYNRHGAIDVAVRDNQGFFLEWGQGFLGAGLT